MKFTRIIPTCSLFIAAFATQALAAPNCAGLSDRVLADPSVLTATSAIVAANGSTPAYCQVDLKQKPARNIRIGLPLSPADGGSGGVIGAWNGKVQNLGGGAYAGMVGAVTGPVSARYIGSSTDTGHSTEWCNEINPETGLTNAQPNCGTPPGFFGGGFVLDPLNELIRWQVREFITNSIHAQVTWSLFLARLYYGQPADRNYWVGCSTGGRQGLELAQKYPRLFDGFLVGAPAMSWNRFIIGNTWPVVVVNELLGPAGLSPAKSDAAIAAAVAACDRLDGVRDGMLNEPRQCKFNARRLLCSAGNSSPTCLTEQEAEAINLIWDGPRNRRGQRLWGGIPKGTSFSQMITGGNSPNLLNDAYVRYWLHQDPTYDWRQISTDNFSQHFQLSDRKFRNDFAETDRVNLDRLIERGAKIVHYHGIGDTLIPPFGSYEYVSSLFERYGVAQTREFMRSFFYPANDHCGGGPAGTPLIDTAQLLKALERWVETGTPPHHVIASSSDESRSRKICAYPDVAVYSGSGDTDAAASFFCKRNAAEPEDLRQHSITAQRYEEAP